nr:MAG TPA: hypothetical protein [Caudoviricetes sp.]
MDSLFILSPPSCQPTFAGWLRRWRQENELLYPRDASVCQQAMQARTMYELRFSSDHLLSMEIPREISIANSLAAVNKLNKRRNEIARNMDGPSGREDAQQPHLV